MDDVTTTQRWVATPDSAGQAAGEFVRVLVRRPWWWGLVAAVEVGYAAFILSFDGLARVMSSGDWVFLKQKGVPLLGVWPAALFPPDDLARLRRGIAGRNG